MIAIPNMEKPQSCDECRILRAEFDGSYNKPITGCRQKMGEKSTLREEWDALIPNCPLIDIVTCGECKWLKKGDKNFGKCTYRTRPMLYCLPTDFCSYGERRTE